jgi:hypothetical protein
MIMQSVVPEGLPHFSRSIETLNFLLRCVLSEALAFVVLR